MAQQTITIYTDDLDGRPIREGRGGTVGFALDGVPVIAGRVLLREARKGNLAALRGLVRGGLGLRSRRD